MRVAQLLPAAHPGDATGNAVRVLDRWLRAAGHRSEVYALTVDPPLRDRVRPFREFDAPGPGDVTLLHFALPSPLSDALARCDGSRVLVYHNLTPPELLADQCPEIAALTRRGRAELRRLAREADLELAVGVSRFNADDLREEGFERTAHLPLPVDFDRLRGPADPTTLRRLRGDDPLFLTVGRVAPNKRIEDLFRIAAYYLRYVSPRARFHAVGSFRGLERYAGSLMELHGRLGLDDRVRLTGHVSEAELQARYRAADAYVCTSLHEGFCVPLVEAMAAGTPIVARRAAAIPETLGDAGVLLDSPDPEVWGELLHAVLTDRSLARRLRDNGTRRLEAFRPERVMPEWIDTLEDLAR